MATSSLSSLDSSGGKDENVERLFKNFTFKCLQVIVQSRIESQTFRPIKDTSSADYFCISIPDNPFVDEQIRKVLDGVKSFPVKDQSVCVEVPLVTTDGDHMYLETWDINFNLSSLDMSANKMQHIFTRMGVTLKSLLSATRAMPAYRLAKNQGEKDGGYRLSYRFYLGKPQTHFLGEGFKTVRAGSVPTAHGLLSINVSFRTKLLLSPEMAASAVAAIEVTDNYFVKECRSASAPPNVSDPRPCSPPHRSHSSRFDSPYHLSVSKSPLEKKVMEIRSEAAPDEVPWAHSSIFNMEELPEPIMGAFSVQNPSHRKVDVEMPFESLMKRSIMARQEHQIAALTTRQNDCGKGSDVDNQMTRVRTHLRDEDDKENCSSSLPDVAREQKMSVEDEFVMVDKPPFAADDDPRDVKSFLSVMFRPANLYEFADCKISVMDYLDNVEAFVTKLEKDMPELDEFCQSIISSHGQDEDEHNPLFS